MENGKGVWRNATGGRVATMSVAKDFDTLAVAITGEVPNTDEAIAILQHALRVLDDQRRIAVMQDAINKPMPAIGRDILQFGKH
jgi:hypothetical protein